MTVDDFELIVDELLKDPQTREAYERRKPAYDLASQVIALRVALDLSQRQLAKLAGMTQSEISRIESAQVQPTWDTVSRVLGSVEAALEIRVRKADGKVLRLTLPGSPPANRRRRGARPPATPR